MSVISNSFEFDNVVYTIILAQLTKSPTESVQELEQANSWTQTIDSYRSVIHDRDL